VAGTVANTLGNLLHSTLQQVGVVREAVERQARSSRMRLDEVMLQRKRRDTLARLGELVYELAVQGKLGDFEDEVPELAELLADVEELDEQLGSAAEPEPEPDHDHGHDHDHDHGAVSSADWTPPGRQARAGAPRDRDELRVWRPVVTVDEGDRGHLGERAADQRGGGESGPGTRAPGGRAARMDRSATRSRSARNDRGGIAFVTDDVAEGDDELAGYMHPDDVPGKDRA
jgi:hypothetical protein